MYVFAMSISGLAGSVLSIVIRLVVPKILLIPLLPENTVLQKLPLYIFSLLLSVL